MVHLKEIAVNDDMELEQEADVIGKRVRQINAQENETASAYQNKTLAQRTSSDSDISVIQRYKEKVINKERFRISDDEKTAVRQDNNRGSQVFYATSEKISEANEILLSVSSSVILLQRPEQIKTGRFFSRKTLKKVMVNANGDVGDLTLPRDCRINACDVTGAATRFKRLLPEFNLGGNKKIVDQTDPQLMTQSADPFISAHYNGDRSKVPGKDEYHNSSSESREIVDQQLGINRYANPNVGEAYVTRSSQPLKAGQWNFHYAPVIMKSGSDNVTLENYADSTQLFVVNPEWNVQMYGLPKSHHPDFKTFHEEHVGRGDHDIKAVTMKVVPESDP
jgi:hypothetical protein